MSNVISPAATTKYTELDGSVYHSQTANLAWEDWDLSGAIPVSAKYVEILTMPKVGSSVGVRKKGSALNRLIGAGANCQASITCGVDANYKIETYDVTGGSLKIIGYWSW